MDLVTGSSPPLLRTEEGRSTPVPPCGTGLALLWISSVWSLASPKTRFPPFICPTLPWSSKEGELMRDGELRSFLKLFCIKYGFSSQSSANFKKPYTTPSKWLFLPSLKHHRERICHRIPYTPFWNHSFCFVQWRRGARGHQPPGKSPDELRQVLDFSPPAKPKPGPLPPYLALRLLTASLSRASAGLRSHAHSSFMNPSIISPPG